jgi:hypothetical protein
MVGHVLVYPVGGERLDRPLPAGQDPPVSRLLPRTQPHAAVLLLAILGALVGRYALDRQEARVAWTAWKERGLQEEAPPAVSGTRR